jgi:hypothetical protein
LTAVAAKELGSWEIGLRFRYASGVPRTPVIGALYDARDDRYQPLFGEQNTTRIPPFWALDLRGQKSFALSEKSKLDLFVDVQNVAAHKNAEEIAYSQDFSKRGYITGLPTVAVVGARLEL